MKRSAHCKQCHEPIRWFKTGLGKWIALDQSSDPQGTYSIQRWYDPVSGGHRAVAVQLSLYERAHAHDRGELLFLAHAASCRVQNPVEASPMPEVLKNRVAGRKTRRVSHAQGRRHG